MKIGIDCRTILNSKGGELAGVGHYTYYLVKKLLEIDNDNEYVLFVDHRFKSAEDFESPRCKVKKFPFYEYKKYLPVAYSQMLISSFLNREKLDLFHSPANIIPLFYNKPSVVTVHDLAIYRYPEFFPKTFLSRQAFSTKILVPKTLIKAKKIIAVSKNTKRDIIENFGIPEEKISVVYEACDENAKELSKAVPISQLTDKFGLKEKYFLFIGTIEPRKNLVRLINSFRNLMTAYDSPAQDCQLILAGNNGWNSEEVYKAIAAANSSILARDKRRSGKERRSGFDTRSQELKEKEGERRSGQERRKKDPIKYIGYVSNEEKFSLLASAYCFVFPSIYEGFGIPVLEAMTSGSPVIASSGSSLEEIADSNSGILVDPCSEAEITNAMQIMLTDEGFREMAKKRAVEKSSHFNWDKCARETLSIYAESVAK